jgi:hypothetical protein
MPVILATQEAEIRRVTVQSQPGKIVPRDPILKNLSQKNRAGGVAQGESPEFKPQYCKKKNFFSKKEKNRPISLMNIDEKVVKT